MKVFICDFLINDKKYEIYNVDKIEGKKSYVGETDYKNRTIFIEKGYCNQMILTLKHELMHVWLYEKGYKDQQDGCFSFEDICEIAALSNDFVSGIVGGYKYWSFEV
jgi:hypothetical protein